MYNPRKQLKKRKPMIRCLFLALGGLYLFVFLGNYFLVDEKDISVDHTIITYEKNPDTIRDTESKLYIKPVTSEKPTAHSENVEDSNQNITDSFTQQRRLMEEGNELRRLYLETLNSEIEINKSQAALVESTAKTNHLIDVSFELTKKAEQRNSDEVIQSKKFGYFTTVMGDYIHIKNALDADGNPVKNGYTAVNPFEQNYELVKVDKDNNKIIYIDLVDTYYSNADSNSKTILRIDTKVEHFSKDTHSILTASTSYVTLPKLTSDGDMFAYTMYIDDEYSLLISARY